MKPSLSILIPSLKEREKSFDILMKELLLQKSHSESLGYLEILTSIDNGEITVGKKRQRLLEEATTDYVVFIDDDDIVPSYYISKILETLKEAKGIDTIGINGHITTNGSNSKKWFISKDHDYFELADVYYRPTNHISPIKREIALEIGYKDLNCGEDYDYCMRLKDSGLLKSERLINEPIYHYRFNTKETRTQ